MAKVVSMEEVKNGSVTLVDLVKLNAWLDFQNDIEYHYAHKKDGENR